MNELSQMLRRAGVVGAGGAGFPTDAKLSAAAGARVDFLIANGAECEPLLNKDQILMTHFPEEILNGMRLAMQAIHAKKGFVAVKSKNRDSIAALNQVLTAADWPIEIFLLPDIYPAGDEVVLIYEVLKKVVAPGALPGTAGVLVDNIETLLNISQAVRGTAVTEKYVTVSGWVRQPATLKLPIGVSVAQALEMAGGVTQKEVAVIMNGLMMGERVNDLDSPITKTTSALLVLPAGHPVVLHKQKKLVPLLKLTRSACTSCSHCSETCPRRLLGHPVLPHAIMRAVSYFSLPDAPKTASVPQMYENARYCVGCGVCDLVCPMGLSPRAINTFIKSQLPPKTGIRGDGVPVPLESREGLKMPTSRLYLKLGINDLHTIHPPLREADRGMVKKVRLLLKQGIGAMTVPVVQVGQRVRLGEPVAEPPEGQLGVALHASINGRVALITSQEIVVEEGGERE